MKCPLFSIFRRIALVTGVALVLAACGTYHSGSSEVRFQEQATSSHQSVPTEYRLGSGDKLKVTVFGHKDVSGDFVIDGSGYLSLPLVGQFKAGGLTAAEFQNSLQKTLNEKYYVNPKVSVEVLNYRPFFILGEVNRPGSYPYVAGIDVLQAVALGGGFTRRARTSSVTIVRDGKSGRVKLSAGPEAPVLPGDTIQVDRRLF